MAATPFAGAGADADYNPAHDDEFPDAFLTDLMAHPDEWRHAGYEAMAVRAPGRSCDPTVMAEYGYRAALVWRRLGHVIDGDNQLGYRWRGCRRPRFLDVAWASQWPDVPPVARQHRRRQPLDGQLRWREAIRS